MCVSEHTTYSECATFIGQYIRIKRGKIDSIKIAKIAKKTRGGFIYPFA